MPAASSAGACTRRRLVIATLASALLAALAAPALGAAAPSGARALTDRSTQVYDSRSGARADLRGAVDASRAAGSHVRSKRAAELRRVGRGAKLQLDALTGTPRSFQNLTGTLSGSAGGSPASVAMSFARSHAAVLGLSSADLDALGAPKVVTSPSGISSVRFAQSFQGIPAYDNDLRINLDRVNRVLSVTGSPVHDLSVASVSPKLSAGQALSALAKNVHASRDFSVKSAGSDARRTTRFSNGDLARLVLFHGKGGTRLAWHLTFEASSLATYDAVVDAATGEVLRRANMVQNVNASVFENYPGDVNGGTQQTVLLDPYLTDPVTGTTLDGPFAQTYLDLNDNNTADAGEEVTPGPYAFTPATAPNGFCLPTKLCGWDPDTAGSWAANQNEAAVQAHYYVSKFHDHLLGTPIGFDAASGNFEDSDRVIVNVDDGAATGPNNAHLNNENMFTPADGSPPRMQLYLFKNRGLGVYRAINSADDGRSVYHEYTHGLSNRLITSSDGRGALLSTQSASMGEGWSDWYALDYVAAQGLEIDNPAASGEIDMGEYTDGTPHINRFEPVDCPPDAGGSNCPGGEPSGGAGSGGFTYADFGHICCTPGNITPEVHSDGEIWAQTLWDIRTALGSTVAERLITDGMRLSPPEPSFLDARNAIIAADSAAPGNGANRDTLWQIFAARGMGFYAYTTDANDLAPLANFSPPPPAGTPTGAIAGRVTDMDTGLPVSGVFVGVAGHLTDPAFPDYMAATTGADGRYAISAPEGTYPLLTIPLAGGYNALTFTAVAVTAGGTTTRDAALRRDWAASRGGAGISGNDNTFAVLDCGQPRLIDQSLGVGYSSYSRSAPPTGYPPNPHLGQDPFAVIELPQAITVESFAVDPGNTCGDDATSATKDYTIATSTDGTTFSVAKEGAFAPADAHRLNMLTPTGNNTNVKFVKITPHSAQNEAPGEVGHFFYDLSELEVYGNSPNVLPSGTLTASPGAVTPGQTVTLTAAFSDPDSAITGYDWDFDGNGSVDQSTTGPSTTTSYPTAGNRLAKVAVKDFRGGAGSASAAVAVIQPQAALPILTLRASGTKGKLLFGVRCFIVCRVSAKLTVDRKTANRLKLRLRTVGRSSKTIQPGAARSITIKLTSKVIRAMKRHHVTRLKATLAVTATYADGRRKTATKNVRIRR
jgi:extracellular elastinolytic metalloproteinase